MADTPFRPPFSAVGISFGGDVAIAACGVSGVSQSAFRLGMLSGLTGAPYRNVTVMPNGGTITTSNFGGSPRAYIQALDSRREILAERKRAKLGVIGMLVVDRRVTTSVWGEDLTQILASDQRIIDAANGDKKAFPLGYYGYTFIKDPAQTWNRANTVQKDITLQTIYKFTREGMGRLPLPTIHNVVYRADMQVTFNAHWGGAAGKVIGSISYFSRDTSPVVQHLGTATGVATGVTFDEDGAMAVTYSDSPFCGLDGWNIMEQKSIQIGNYDSGGGLVVTRVPGEGFVFLQTQPNGGGERTWKWKTWNKDPLGGPAKEAFDIDTSASSRGRWGMWFIPPKKLNPRLRWR